MKSRQLLELPLDRIDPPPLQLRQTIHPDRLEALARSMADLGLLQPIRVAPVGDRYRIIAGHRRYLAAQRLGWPTIPAIVDKALIDLNLAKSLHENVFRDDLSPIEEARIVRHLIEESYLTPDQAAATLRHSIAWVHQRLELLSYPEDLQKALHERLVPIGAAPYLARIDDPDYRARALESARDRTMTVREAAEWERQYQIYKAARDAGQQPTIPTVELVASEAAKTICDVCAGVAYVHTTKLLRVCFDCVQALTQAQRALAGS
jgi:ParB family chromosome partitioning protein